MKTYTVKEVAELLHVNPETVRRWIRDEKLVAKKTSNKGGNKIFENDLLIFLAASPAYTEGASSLLIKGLAATAVALATHVTDKAIENNRLKNVTVENEAVIKFLRAEIASYRSLVTQKKASIRQIEKEIVVVEERIKRVEDLLASIDEILPSADEEKWRKMNE